MQDTGLKNRIFLALFISIIFFIVYDYFFIQPQLSKTSNEVVKNEKVTTKSEAIKKVKELF
jgi:K+-sensing histidine kinase KdpD